MAPPALPENQGYDIHVEQLETDLFITFFTAPCLRQSLHLEIQEDCMANAGLFQALDCEIADHMQKRPSAAELASGHNKYHLFTPQHTKALASMSSVT